MHFTYFRTQWLLLKMIAKRRLIVVKFKSMINIIDFFHDFWKLTDFIPNLIRAQDAQS